MKYRNTIIAVVILVLLGSYIYFFERKPVQETEPGKPNSPFFASFDAEKVSRIEVVHQDTTQPLIMERAVDKSWDLKSPVVAKADKLEVDTLLSEFKDLTPSRILEGKDLNLSEYGLIAPELTLTISFSDPKLAPQKILVGNKTPSSDEYYVKKGTDANVELLPVKAFSGWDRDVTAYRDKTVLAFDAERIAQLELTYSKKTFVCEKDKDQWWVTKPERIKADRNKLDDILWKLHGLQVKQFVDEQQKNLKPYGLDNPQTVFILKSQDGNLFSLALGKTDTTAGMMYAKTADKTYIFGLDTTAINEITISSITALRDRTVLTFNTDTIIGIELKYPDKTISFAKENGQWWITQSLGSARDKPKRMKADESKVDELLWELNGLSIKEFGEPQPKNLAKYGLDKPAILVTLQSNTTKLPTLSLGKTDEKNNLIYALSSDKDFVFELDVTLAKDLTVNESELQETKSQK